MPLSASVLPIVVTGGDFSIQGTLAPVAGGRSTGGVDRLELEISFQHLLDDRARSDRPLATVVHESHHHDFGVLKGSERRVPGVGGPVPGDAEAAADGGIIAE